MSKLLTAVSMHETAAGTSNLFNTNNNLFGMKHPQIRKTTSQGSDRNGNARYISPLQSIIDMTLYLDNQGYPKDIANASDLVHLMKSKGYFEDSIDNYLQGVEHFNEAL